MLISADYAKSFGLDRMLRLNTGVAGMERRADGKPGWTLALSGKDGATTSEDFDFVAVCTGQFNEPRELHCPGEDGFLAQGGQILHSSTYSDPTLAKGRRVVVLGGSKSATDIAVNAVKSGAREVTIVMREPVWRIPYFIGGLVNFKRILYIRAQEEMFPGWGSELHGTARAPHRRAADLGELARAGEPAEGAAQAEPVQDGAEGADRGRRQLLGADRNAGLLPDGRRRPHQGGVRQLRPL